MMRNLSVMRSKLIAMLLEKSFQYSKEPIFKLVSGKTSNFYVNCKPTIMNALGMKYVGNLFYEDLRESGVVGVGGLTFGADPIASSIASTSAFLNEYNASLLGPTSYPLINFFSIRKTKKDHGIARWIEGDMKSGDPVAIVDDVATTGGSTIQAIERSREEGLVVKKVIILVDREENGAMDKIREFVNDASSIITVSDLLRAQRL